MEGHSKEAVLGGGEILRRVQEAGLRGRGGGWYPTGRKWHAVRIEGGEPLVVANGAEGEPGSIKDRFLMLTRPGEVLEGLRLTARALGAREAVIFLKGSFDAPAASLSSAMARGHEGDGLRITLRRGDDSYVAGEETAILEVLEGRRAWPRPKPPYPAAVGFEGRPTLVQNVETLWRVREAVDDPVSFRAAERTLVSVWGHVRRPGVYDVRLGTSLASIVEEMAGGAPDGVGWIFPGGPSTSPLGPSHLDTPLDPESLRAAGSALGTAAMLVVGASVPRDAVVTALAAFYERESCGQCPPCTIGTASLLRIARLEADGAARARDLADVKDVSGFMADHGYCAHCRTASRVVGNLLGRGSERIARPAEPVVAPGFDPFSADSKERSAIEHVLDALGARPAEADHP